MEGKQWKYANISYLFIYFEQYLFRGAQFSEAGLNGALMKRKKTTQKKITDKKELEQLSITKVLEAQFGLDLKCLFRPKPNLFKSCSLLRARGRVFQIFTPLNLKEPWYLVVRASGRRNKSLWRVLYVWKSCVWLNSLSKYARARPWRFLNTSMHFRWSRRDWRRNLTLVSNICEQHQYSCSGRPPTDSMKSVSNFLSSWLANWQLHF